MDCGPPGSSVHGILQARILEWVAMPSFRGSSQPGIESRSLALQADSLPSETPRKPKDPGVGSLSLLWGIFPAQELKRGLLHFRQILYQLSYQGSPLTAESTIRQIWGDIVVKIQQNSLPLQSLYLTGNNCFYKHISINTKIITKYMRTESNNTDQNNKDQLGGEKQGNQSPEMEIFRLSP